MWTTQCARTVSHRPSPVILLHFHVAVSWQGRHTERRPWVSVRIASVIGHGEITMISVRPAWIMKLLDETEFICVYLSACRLWYLCSGDMGPSVEPPLCTVWECRWSGLSSLSKAIMFHSCLRFLALRTFFTSLCSVPSTHRLCSCRKVTEMFNYHISPHQWLLYYEQLGSAKCCIMGHNHS